MKWATFYSKVDLIMLKKWGVRAGDTKIPLRDYWDAGLRPEQVCAQAVDDNYFIPEFKSKFKSKGE